MFEATFQNMDMTNPTACRKYSITESISGEMYFEGGWFEEDRSERLSKLGEPAFGNRK
jgi:hypothetical protein